MCAIINISNKNMQHLFYLLFITIQSQHFYRFYKFVTFSSGLLIYRIPIIHYHCPYHPIQQPHKVSGYIYLILLLGPFSTIEMHKCRKKLDCIYINTQTQSQWVPEGIPSIKFVPLEKF